MYNAQNGIRIKVFPGSNDTNSISGGGTGYARNVTYEDFVCESEPFSLQSGRRGRHDSFGDPRSPDCDNPIILTTCYSSPQS